MRPREGNRWMENRRERRGGGGRDTRRRPPSPPFPFSPLVVAVWPCPGLASGWFYLLAPLRPFPLSFVCAPSTTTARQLECKHLPSPCLLFLPSLHICTCKGLLRLIWRLTGWLASMYYHNSKKIKKIKLRIKLKDDFGLLVYVFFLRMIKD